MPSRPTSLRIPRSLSVSLSRRALATLPPPLPASLPPSVATIKPLLSAIRETILRADELLKKESLWVDRLDGAAQKLESMDGVEIAVYAPDELTGADDLISALLEDPLSEDEVRRTTLRGRATGDAQVRKIRYGPETMVDFDGLALDSDLLRNFSILEIPSTTSPALALPHLLLSSCPLLILSPHTLLSSPSSLKSILPILLRHPSLTIALNLPSPYLPPAHINHTERFLEAVRSMGADETLIESLRSRVVEVNGTRALIGVDVLRGKMVQEMSQGRKIDIFASEFTAANVDALKGALLLRSTASFIDNTSTTTVPSLVPSMYISHSSLSATLTSLRLLATHLSSFTTSASHLRSQSLAQADHFLAQSLIMEPKYGSIRTTPHTSLSFSSSSQVGGETVASAVAKGAKAEVREYLEGEDAPGTGWTGMVLLGRVDDLQDGIEQAVDKGWGGEGERALIASSAHLSTIARQTQSFTDSILSSPPHATLHSPLLLNSLSSSQPPPSAHPSLFLPPLSSRRDQLLAPGGPASYLVLRAQRAVLGTWVTSGASLGGAYLGWLEGMVGMESAGGLGLLGVLAGWRWGMGRWGKAKGKFWKDWERVEEGLGEDLKTHIESSIKPYLVERPLKAADGMEDLIARRRVVLEERIAEIDALGRQVQEFGLGPTLAGGAAPAEEGGHHHHHTGDSHHHH